MHHHRADDMPAYLVVFIVGHVSVAALLTVNNHWDWPLWVHEIVWPALVLVLSLAHIQPIKGAVVALQWALRMHGFDSDQDRPTTSRDSRRRGNYRDDAGKY
jgi:uncharacterized protein (DUF983 family)